MSAPSREIKTRGVVLRRTNYGEADRILNVITPEGKLAVMAKGVRKSRSKLAGGVEMFTLSEYHIHMGRGELGVLTGAKMVRHYGEIVKDLARMELSATMLKRVSAVAESSDSADYFKITEQVLSALDDGVEMGLVEAWFWLNIMRAMGEEANLYRDAGGEKLSADSKYDWLVAEGAFVVNERGEYGANEIKMLRLMLTSGLEVVRRIKTDNDMMDKVLKLAQAVGRC